MTKSIWVEDIIKLNCHINKFMLSNIKFRKILNDLKRRPEDAAKDLKISLKKINNILESTLTSNVTLHCITTYKNF